MEIESLRMDNVKLYEKIKFLQNYRPNSGYQTNIDDEAGKKYASQYEGMCMNIYFIFISFLFQPN